MNNFSKYKKLFLSTFKLSACTFGGGFVIVPLMKKRFVEELGWIGEDEMLDLIAIAQSSPGAIDPYDSRAVCDHLYLGISGKWTLPEIISAQKSDHGLWRTSGGGSYE